MTFNNGAFNIFHIDKLIHGIGLKWGFMQIDEYFKPVYRFLKVKHHLLLIVKKVRIIC